MNKFPIIEKLMLPVIVKDGGYYVSATYLEDTFERAPLVYGGDQTFPTGWSTRNYESDTHRARLLCVEPLQETPKTKSEEALDFVQFVANELSDKFLTSGEIYKKAMRILEMKDE